MTGPTEVLSWSGWALCLVGAYLIGSVSFALILGKINGIDLRKVGSGNVGATNCGRILGRKWGVLCFVLDLCKGLVPVAVTGYLMGLLGQAVMPVTAAWAWVGIAAAAVIGHIFPIWLGFRGGKGVATGLGVLLGFFPLLTVPGVAAGLTWAIVTAGTRYVALASVIAAAMLPMYLLGFVKLIGSDLRADGQWPLLVVTGLLALLVVVRHTSNLKRMLAGTESRIGKPSPHPTPSARNDT